MKKIYETMEMLNCHQDESVQQKGIEIAKKIENIEIFVKPFGKYYKDYWENCAIVLSDRSDEELSIYLTDLLEWLQDINWPGSIIILERLQNYKDIDKLAKALEVSVKKAQEVCDSIWLDNMKPLLKNELLKKTLEEKYNNAYQAFKPYIDYIYSLIDEKKFKDIQLSGIKLAETIDDVFEFIRPMEENYNRNIWENCAIIISKRSDELLTPYLLQLIEWGANPLWQGSQTIMERLNKFENIEILVTFIDLYVKRAINLNLSLENTKDFLLNKQIRYKLKVIFPESYNKLL